MNNFFSFARFAITIPLHQILSTNPDTIQASSLPTSAEHHSSQSFSGLQGFELSSTFWNSLSHLTLLVQWSPSPVFHLSPFSSFVFRLSFERRSDKQSSNFTQEYLEPNPTQSCRILRHATPTQSCKASKQTAKHTTSTPSPINHH